MNRFAPRLTALEAAWASPLRPPVAIGRVDDRWLSPAQRERAAHLRARIDAVGPEGLTPDELMACAEIRGLMTVEDGRP